MDHRRFLEITNDEEYDILDDKKRWFKYYFDKVLVLNDMSQTKFAKMYGINQGNLSQWLVGKKHSITSREKTFEYIRSLLNPEKTSEIKEPISTDILVKNISSAKSNLKESINPIDIAYNKLINTDPRRFIVFLDGDNCLSVVKQLEKLIDFSPDFHVFSVMSVKKIHAYKQYQKKPWLTFVSTYWACSDAADHALSMEATRFHFLYYPDVPFVLVSGDHFLIETVDRLKGFSRTTFGLMVHQNDNIIYALAISGLYSELENDFKALTPESSITDIQVSFLKYNMSVSLEDIQSVLSQLKGHHIVLLPDRHTQLLQPQRVEQLKELLVKHQTIRLFKIGEHMKLSESEKRYTSWLHILSQESLSRELGYSLKKNDEGYYITKL